MISHIALFHNRATVKIKIAATVKIKIADSLSRP